MNAAARTTGLWSALGDDFRTLGQVDIAALVSAQLAVHGHPASLRTQGRNPRLAICIIGLDRQGGHHGGVGCGVPLIRPIS